MVKYATVDDVRNFTNVNSAEFSDAQITSMIEYAESFIDARTGHDFTEGGVTLTEYYDGNGTDSFFLNHFPVLSVSSLSVDANNDGTYTELTEGRTNDYVLYNDVGRVVLTDDCNTTSVWPDYPKSIKITYTYGYSSVPDYVKFLTVLIVANLLKPGDFDNMISEVFKLVDRLGNSEIGK